MQTLSRGTKLNREKQPKKTRRRGSRTDDKQQPEDSRGWRFRLRGDFLAASILSLLKRRYAHGYRLAGELVKAGLPMFDSATLYRTLRDLERAGLVSSFWDTSSSGPARRMYSLTRTGDVFLSLWIDTLRRYQNIFRRAAKEHDVEPGEAATAPSPARRRPSGTRKRATGRARSGRSAVE